MDGRATGIPLCAEFDCAESTCDVLASSSCASCPLCGIVCHHHDTVRSVPIREPLLGNEHRHMDQSDLTGKIIGCALKVHSILGPGLLESAGSANTARQGGQEEQEGGNSEIRNDQ